MDANQNHMYFTKHLLRSGMILLAIVLLLYAPIIQDMYLLWMNNTDNSHGLLVPPISFYLIYQKRRALRLHDIETSYRGLALLLLSLLGYIIGIIGGIEILPRLALVSTLISLVLFHLGRKIFSLLFFPLLFLFFMVPVPDSITGAIAFPLQMAATKLAATIIGGLSIPVLREGNMLYFANTSLEVAEACSGIRSLVAYIMLGALFAYMAQGRGHKKMLLLAAAIPLAFLANLVRVVSTGILAHFWGSRVARGFLHEFSGIIIFICGFIVLFWIFKLLDRKNGPAPGQTG